MASFTCGFIGLGLIGGSIARALKENKGKDAKILAYDPDRDSVSRACEDGVVDEPLSEIDDRLSDCDIVFLCAPVSVNLANAEKIKPFLSKDTILTDVGSIKGEMHRKIRELGLDDRFIGGHPMAGSERIGYANSKAIFLENAYYIITKTQMTETKRLRKFSDLVKSMGAIPLIMTPEEHDRVTAAVSHLPHVISASLVNLVKDSDSVNGEMRMVAAGGFKDITRISSSSPDMWEQICLSNPTNISELLEKYISSLEDVRRSIDSRDGDALNAFFDSARRYRDSFIDASRGPIKALNDVHVEIPDRPGALADVLSVLALHSINVKNVGIIHNREVETGSLNVELHNHDSVKRAKEILESKGYAVTIG